MSDIIERLNDEENYVDAVDDAIRVIELQAKILDKYAKHTPGCLSREKVRADNGRFSTYGCNCGLDQAARKLKRARGIDA